jgi:F-type H+-transporting ATPase subunit b
MDNPLVQPDPGLFIWTILTFLVLLALLTKFAWKPLLAALEARRELIAKAVDDAEKTRKELERVKQESLGILAKARVEAEGILSRSRADAEAFREEMRQKAIVDANAIVKRAEREIQLETNRAIEQLRRESVDLSLAIATKLLQRNVTKDDNVALIDETIRQIDTMKH